MAVTPENLLESKTTHDHLSPPSVGQNELGTKKPPKKYITKPLLFSIERDNKTSYLFGTVHGISYDEIPAHCLKIFETCSDCVIEDSGKPLNANEQEKIDNFYRNTILRDSNSEPWHSKLLPEVLVLLQKCISTFCSEAPAEYVHPIESLKIWAAIMMADQGHSQLCVRTDNEDQEAEIMDIGISGMFPSENFHGLETQFEIIEQSVREYGNSIEDIIKWYDKSAPFLSKDCDENAQKIKNEDEESCDKYRTGRLLYDQKFLAEIDQDDGLKTRNLNWLPKIIEYHKNLSGPVLFTVGAGHVLGKDGLLSLLSKNGFTLKSYTTDGTFIPFTCPGVNNDSVSVLGESLAALVDSFPTTPLQENDSVSNHYLIKGPNSQPAYEKNLGTSINIQPGGPTHCVLS